MDHKWIINRMGTVDFWYYDDQEFYFEDGRMLLRGSNGSGKSVTMQSFIPLLLDGNRSPQRLDPFGSKDRRLDNYMIEEDDDRDERIGYLYIEFKNGEKQISIGMGMRARKRQGLDTWYFYVAGDKIIQQNMLLTKNDREIGRLCLTKNELRAAIGTDGRVFDSQREYMNAVNTLIFGFPSVEDYGEMINLLIQLRSPKLSKEYKPTVIHEILNESLPALTEEDLRPLSEAIENMDTQKDRLEAMEESKKASDKISRAFDNYNKRMLFEKIRYYLNGLQAAEDLEKQRLVIKREKEENINAYETNQASLERFRQEEEEKKKLRSELEQKYEGELSAKERLTAVENSIDEQARLFNKKENEIKDKEASIVKCGNDIKDIKNESEQLLSEIEKLLDEMDSYGDECEFEEHSKMKEELYKDIKNKYDFSFSKDAARRYEKVLTNALSLIRVLHNAKQEQEILTEKYDDSSEKLDAEMRRFEKTELELCEIKKSVIESIYEWSENNRFLKPTDAELTEAANSVNIFEFKDYSLALKPSVEASYKKANDRLIRLSADFENSKKELENQRAEKKEELSRLESIKDVEPERSDEVVKNRKRLSEMNIPYIPFYKFIRFKEGVSDKTINNVEEALYRMGILDALIIPEEFEKQVLQADAGMCDKYLFQGKSVEGNISSILTPDGLTELTPYLKNALNVIYYGFPGTHTAIRDNGQYRIGAVTGNISGSYVSKYIGEAARERNRLSLIEGLKLEIANLDSMIADYDNQIDDLKKDMDLLTEEYNSLPSVNGILETCQKLRSLEAGLSVLRKEKEEYFAKLTDVNETVKKLSLEVVLLRETINLPAELSSFEAAVNGIGIYKDLLMDLENKHCNYINLVLRCASLTEQYEDLTLDLENLLYDKSGIERNLKSLRSEAAAIKERLKLSGYEEVKAKIDECIERLDELPSVIVMLEKSATRLETELSRHEKEERQKSGEIELQESKNEKIKNVMLDELALGYTEAGEMKLDDKSGIIEAFEMLEEDLGDLLKRDIADMTVLVQQRIIENSQYLTEYSLATVELFEDDPLFPNLKIKRIDIKCRIEGKQARFNVLSGRLAAEIEIQKELIKENDRKLFVEVLGGEIARKISDRIFSCENWVEKINKMMEGMNTSSGLSLSLAWKSKSAETEEELNTKELVELLKRDAAFRKDSDFDKITSHFNSKVSQARKRLSDSENTLSLHAIMRDILDYRKWFDFQLKYTKTGERQRELTNKAFYQFSGGEKAMTMYVPLFSAVAAKYDSAGKDAPRLISLDEAFAGVDDKNIKDMFKLMVEFNFNFVINSQALWGDYETVPRLSIYQLHRPNNVKFVTVMRYIWNGFNRIIVPNGGADNAG